MRRSLLTLFTVLLAAGQPTVARAQSALDLSNPPWDGGGGYLSWGKLLLIGIVFLIWVKLADRVNRDAMGIGEQTGMKPEFWNPITVVSFLAGFFAAISIPIFLAGYPLYLIAAFGPPFAYFMIRRSEMKKNPALEARTAAKPGMAAVEPPLQQDEGPEITFIAAGSGNEQQMNLIRARQTTKEGFTTAKVLIDQCLRARAEEVLLDFTRDATSIRMKVDGIWQPLPPMDRAQGDSMLASLKFLAGLNPGERRTKQTGRFRLKTPDEKCGLSVLSQGVATGERVQLKFARELKKRLTIVQLGMFPDVAEKFIGYINHQGMTAVSAMPSGGLTASWQSLLDASDRITRDAVGLIPATDKETGVENVTIHQYDEQMGGTPQSILKRVMLTQPDCLVVPDLSDQASMDAILAECTKGRSALTRVHARSAAEALLRLYAMAGDRESFIENIRAVSNQRLIRRLCDDCKMPIQVAPKMIAQLGGDPHTQNMIYDQYRLPPPEQRVDEKGRPIEIPPCDVCTGLSFIGRIAVFEILEVNDAVRAVLAGNPTVDAIENAARQSGKKSIAAEAYKLVLLGVTSLNEVQRALK